MSAAGGNSKRGGKSWLERHARVSSKQHRGIKTDDRLTFLQQFSTLLNSGTPLLDALRLCARQSLSTKLAGIISTIANQVASGSAFHKACGAYANVFPSHWVHVIQVGEMSGEMASVLSQLCVQAHNAQKIRGKLVSAMVYPAILTTTAVLCVVVMLWKVVPTFAAFFNDFGAKLPGITQMVLSLSDFVRTKGLYTVAVMVALGFAFRHWLRQESGRRLFNLVTMATPVLGEMLVHAAMEKFANNLALLLRSGVPLLQALETLREVMNTNILYRRGIELVQRRVSSGGTLAGAIEETGLFPSMVAGMVRVGEGSGKLPLVLDQVATYYAQKVEVGLMRAMTVIEPAIIVGMGGTVGVIMAAIYLPMFQLSSAAR